MKWLTNAFKSKEHLSIQILIMNLFFIFFLVKNKNRSRYIFIIFVLLPFPFNNTLCCLRLSTHTEIFWINFYLVWIFKEHFIRTDFFFGRFWSGNGKNVNLVFCIEYRGGKKNEKNLIWLEITIISRLFFDSALDFTFPLVLDHMDP